MSTTRYAIIGRKGENLVDFIMGRQFYSTIDAFTTIMTRYFLSLPVSLWGGENSRRCHIQLPLFKAVSIFPIITTWLTTTPSSHPFEAVSTSPTITKKLTTIPVV